MSRYARGEWIEPEPGTDDAIRVASHRERLELHLEQHPPIVVLYDKDGNRLNPPKAEQ